MALPSSGQISMSSINQELGRSATAQISLDTAENGGYVTLNSGCSTPPSSGNPASMSEWYGFDQCCYIGSLLWNADGTLSSDCGAYADFNQNVYSNNSGAGTVTVGSKLYSGGSGNCSGIWADSCFTDFSNYWCTDSVGTVDDTGGCTT